MLKPLRGVHRALFLGDSITYSGGYVNEIELYLFSNFWNSKPEVINLGLPSETLSGLSEEGHAGGAFPRPDLHERLTRALDKIKPDMVIACYGMNDGIYYPFSEERFTEFKKGYLRLESEVKSRHAKLWILTPPPFDPLPLKGKTLPGGQTTYPSGTPYEDYDDVLTKYSDWLMSRRRNGWNVIDLHRTFVSYVQTERKRSPGFTLSPDGVHPNELGHHLMAKAVLNAWGAKDDDVEVPDHTMLGPVTMRQAILKDAWLTEVDHNRPGMAKGLPLGDALVEAEQYRALIVSLHKGTGVP